MLTLGDAVGPYIVGPVIHDDLFCTLHEAATSDGTEAWLKHHKDELTALSEPLTLRMLHAEPDPRFVPFLPDVPAVAPNGVNVFKALEGFYNLEQVKNRHGDLNPRDMAWMYRRLLVAVGHADNAAQVHGAVLPQNIWIHPEKHGLVLAGWSHALSMTVATPEDEDEPEPEPATVNPYPGYEEWYPDDSHATVHLDTYMATNVANWLCGGDPTDPTVPNPALPHELRTVMGGSLKTDPKTRIGQGTRAAWDAMGYFDAAIERAWGKRTFRPFSMA